MLEAEIKMVQKKKVQMMVWISGCLRKSQIKLNISNRKTSGGCISRN